MKSTPTKKNLGIGSPVFCTFSFTPTKKHRPSAAATYVSLLNFSETGRGGGRTCSCNSYASFCNGSINGMEDKCPPPTHPKFPSFLFGAVRGHKSVLMKPTLFYEMENINISNSASWGGFY